MGAGLMEYAGAVMWLGLVGMSMGAAALMGSRRR